MEDTARLALIERFVKNRIVFKNFLRELLKYINLILENPLDLNMRVMKSDLLKSISKSQDFCDYLKYIGLRQRTDGFVFPINQPLSRLIQAQVAIRKKIKLCYGPERIIYSSTRIPKCQTLTPAKVLNTNDPFLLSIQTMFNDMLKYEDDHLQDMARSKVPLVNLKMQALCRMREYQKKIKMGEVKAEDMSFDTALLAEVLSWFKNQFFSWVDRPPCDLCGGVTQLTTKFNAVIANERCLVEEYACTQCANTVQFPRHNSPRVLLDTRRGRCGEFANCFTLICRALGYDTRYVCDTADHVWCEVFDYDMNSWIHIDPCEAKMNAPLMYEHGWRKKLAYVVAVSRDDLQDVTWRYSCDHRQTRLRRTRCSETSLLDAILRLREHRHAQLSAPRRRYLAKRTLQELVFFMQERKPEDYESEGRLSGSLAWRCGRGELRPTGGHVFVFSEPGEHVIRYYCSTDHYTVSQGDDATGYEEWGMGAVDESSLDTKWPRGNNNVEEATGGTEGVKGATEGAEGTEEGEKGGKGKRLMGWAAGVFACRHIFRKVETDWRMTYLAREEGEETATLSWKLECAPDMEFQSLTVRAVTALYGTGNIEWTLKFDDYEKKVVKLGEEATQFNRRFKRVVIAARLGGGRRGGTWQHAQLFRQPADCRRPTLEVRARAARDLDLDLD